MSGTLTAFARVCDESYFKLLTHGSQQQRQVIKNLPKPPQQPVQKTMKDPCSVLGGGPPLFPCEASTQAPWGDPWLPYYLWKLNICAFHLFHSWNATPNPSAISWLTPPIEGSTPPPQRDSIRLLSPLHWRHKAKAGLWWRTVWFVTVDRYSTMPLKPDACYILANESVPINNAHQSTGSIVRWMKTKTVNSSVQTFDWKLQIEALQKTREFLNLLQLDKRSEGSVS